MGMMIHRHKAKVNGAARKAAPSNKPKAENKEVKVDEPEKVDDEVKYTKSEINRSSTDRLKEIATEIGIEDSADKTGGELKKLIIEKLGL